MPKYICVGSYYSKIAEVKFKMSPDNHNNKKIFDKDSDYLNNTFNLTYGYWAQIQQKIDNQPKIYEATYFPPYSHSPNNPDINKFAY